MKAKENTKTDLKIEIFIVEDKNEHMKQIKKAINKCILKSNYPMKISFCTNSSEEFLKYLESRKNKVGVYFLDVDMRNKKLTGYNLAEKILEVDKNSEINFVTSYVDTRDIAYDHHSIRNSSFIEKDINGLDTPEFRKKINEQLNFAYEKFTKSGCYVASIYPFKVEDGERMYVKHSEILYATTIGRTKDKNIVLHTTFGECEFRETLVKMLNDLGGGFARPNNQYLVNLSKIITYSHDEIEIDNKITIPVSEKLRKKFKASYDAASNFYR